jgi:hypothetical protein
LKTGSLNVARQVIPFFFSKRNCISTDSSKVVQCAFLRVCISSSEGGRIERLGVFTTMVGQVMVCQGNSILRTRKIVCTQQTAAKKTKVVAAAAARSIRSSSKSSSSSSSDGVELTTIQVGVHVHNQPSTEQGRWGLARRFELRPPPTVLKSSI